MISDKHRRDGWSRHLDRSKLAELSARLDGLAAERAALAAERDEYRKLYLQALETCRKLELGLVGPRRERLSGGDAQLTMSMLGMLLGNDVGGSAAPPPPAPPPVETPVAAHTRAKPTGRKPLPEKLPRIEVELLPPEVQKKGTDAFVRIGEDVTETVERRPASLVVVRVRKPKFVPKGRDATAETTVLQAPPPELPIHRGLAGPGLLADTIVRRWQDHLPLHRLERMYGREGLELARSTICGWHEALGGLVKPLLDAMRADARGAPYLCTDATGVLVQAREKCRRGHFWVVIAPGRHVLFRYTAKHYSAAVDGLLEGYEGYLVADAHAVFDHLYKRGTSIEVACWAHARRYWWKALETDPERARQALAYIGGLFRVERAAGDALPEVRLAARRAESKAIVDAFFTWCEAEGGRSSTRPRPPRRLVTPSINVSRFSGSWTTVGSPSTTMAPSERCGGKRSGERIGSSSAPTMPPRSTPPSSLCWRAASSTTSSPTPISATSSASCRAGRSAESWSSPPSTGRRSSRTRTLSSGSTPTSSGAHPSACSTNIPRPSSTRHLRRQRRCSSNGYPSS